MGFDTSGAPDDSSDRLYGISVELEYKLLSAGRVLSTGRGRTLMMSSSRVVFESEQLLQPGILAELNVTWPVRLADNIGLTLNIFGRTVRANGKCVTIDILRHEFQRIQLSEDLAEHGTAKAMAAGSTITGYASSPDETSPDSEPVADISVAGMPPRLQ